MELSPPQITLGAIEAGEVYLFPVRVRNVGSKQERYRVKYVSASAGGHVARIAEGTYDKETARLAPGLAAIVTLTLSFQHRGHITGQLCVDTEGVGTCELAINGVVR
ncbi:hypothetical protein Poli38472_002521 [Pythium oligandrum]|uniref:Uncharacterized protein n=1 Tax=Pythium oligandrum TaxID=41045 RepID=A0A8K1CHZ5_PYTOL|nr:hypothetical protein Poli38472_002521 [Pythium oligandrum]|eukprot:TMW63580.1 hypothetical protein Poli38472_002521 [Pythium oligandrum]